MRAGLLRHRITFLLKTLTRDAMGGEVITWQAGDSVFAQVTPLTGREFFEAQQVASEVSITFSVRYRSDVTSAWRILWRSQQYDIINVIDVAGMDRALDLLCRTAQN